jgi:hypothetical protein
MFNIKKYKLKKSGTKQNIFVKIISKNEYLQYIWSPAIWFYIISLRLIKNLTIKQTLLGIYNKTPLFLYPESFSERFA